MPQSFNERYLANGKVPGGGETGGVAADSPRGRAVGTPAGVKKASGTENLGTTTVTKRAEPNGTPSGGKDRRPAKVDKFNGGRV